VAHDVVEQVPPGGDAVTTTEALRTHRLVTARMRVIRRDGTKEWATIPVEHHCSWACSHPKFNKLIDALNRAQEGLR